MTVDSKLLEVRGIFYLFVVLIMIGCTSVAKKEINIENPNQKTLLIDDVNVNINKEKNVIANGDFSKGLIYWSTWNDESDIYSLINPSDYHSKNNSYAFSIAKRACRTFYSTTEKTHNWDRNNDMPYDSSYPIWISVVPGDNIDFSFWYKYRLSNAYILGLRKNGGWGNLFNVKDKYSNEWERYETKMTIPNDIVGIGIQFDYIP